MEYTNGNWTVRDSVSGTSSSAFNVTVNPGVRAHYARKGATDNELTLVNISGDGLVAAPEVVRFGRSNVANVYTGTDIPVGSQLPTKDGTRMLVEVKENLTAINTVSGAEIDLPCKAWMVLQVPRSNVVTTATLDYLINRLLSALYMGADEQWDGVSRFFNIARGDLDPSDAA